MVACPAGSYQPIFNDNYATYDLSDDSLASNDDGCLVCPSGYYCANEGQTAITDYCGVGYYCPDSSTESEPSTTYCAAKEYCPQGSYKANACPIGFYQEDTKKGYCEQC